MTDVPMLEFDADLIRNTTEHHRTSIRKRAEEVFRDHVLTQETAERWYCGKPGTGFYSFRVLCVPNAIVVTGDIGELILTPYCSPPGDLEWLKSACKDARYPDYALGKCPPSHRQKEFLSGDAVKYLRQMISDAQNWYDTCQERPDEIWSGSEVGPDYVFEVTDTVFRICKRWLDNLDQGELPPRTAWSDAVYHTTFDAEFDPCLDWSAEMLLCFYALCWFVKNLPEMKEIST